MSSVLGQILGLIVPILAAQFLPESAPQAEIIEVALYLLSLVFGGSLARTAYKANQRKR